MQIFRTAVEEADALKHEVVGLAHMLLGVLRSGGVCGGSPAVRADPWAAVE